jgi:glyoxylate reductase
VKKLLITRAIPEEVLANFRDKVEITSQPEGATLSQEEAIKLLGDYDALMTLGFRANSAVIDAGTKLKVIGNLGVGYDNIDWEYCTKKKVAVVNTPHEVMHPTAELALSIILALTRQIVYFDKRLRQTLNTSSLTSSFARGSTAMYGRTLGIIGFGRIGKALAFKAKGLGMKIIYNDVIRATPEQEAEAGAKFMEFDEVLKTADVITIHCPFLPQNFHLISDREFGLMKPTAYFVNAARGPITDEAALIRALKEKKIAGAGLDVFEKEPLVSPELAKFDNVVIVPHIGTLAYDVRLAMATEALTGIVGVLNGEVPYNVVNPEVLG